MAVEIVLGQRTTLRILFLLFSTFVLVSMLLFLSSSLGNTSGLETQPNHPPTVEGTAPQKAHHGDRTSRIVHCESLESAEECSSYDKCAVLEGDACVAPGTTEREPIFAACVSKAYAAAYPTIKMELDPKVPHWMSSHPDRSSFCARPRGRAGPVVRFQKLIPPDWVQEKCASCCVPSDPIPEGEDNSLALIVAVYNEYLSLENSMKSWKANGFLDYVQETILYIDGGDPDLRVKIEEVGRAYGFTVINEEKNLGLPRALERLVNAAKSRFVLFLEKDWKLIESRETMTEQLDIAKRLMSSKQNGSRADAIKFRSRFDYGWPNIHPKATQPPSGDDEAGITQYWQNVPKWEPHLFCNLLHYQQDDFLTRTYPQRMWKCGCDHSFWCFDGSQCGWTNNPMMFGRKWWIDTWTHVVARAPGSNFEAATYYSTEWLEPHWVVAGNNGLFKHEEVGEHAPFQFYSGYDNERQDCAWVKVHEGP